MGPYISGTIGLMGHIPGLENTSRPLMLWLAKALGKEKETARMGRNLGVIRNSLFFAAQKGRRFLQQKIIYNLTGFFFLRADHGGQGTIFGALSLWLHACIPRMKTS